MRSQDCASREKRVAQRALSGLRAAVHVSPSHVGEVVQAVPRRPEMLSRRALHVPYVAGVPRATHGMLYPPTAHHGVHVLRPDLYQRAKVRSLFYGLFTHVCGRRCCMTRHSFWRMW